MWENNDKKNYNLHKQYNVGQICNDSFSLKIRELSGILENKKFLYKGKFNFKPFVAKAPKDWPAEPLKFKVKKFSLSFSYPYFL